MKSKLGHCPQLFILESCRICQSTGRKFRHRSTYLNQRMLTVRRFEADDLIFDVEYFLQPG